MKQSLRICSIALLVLSSGCGGKSSKSSGGPGFQLPPTEKLTLEQEAEALELYSDYTIMSSATAGIGKASINLVLKTDEQKVRDLLTQNCQMVHLESQQGQTVSLQNYSRNLPNKNCPIDYQDSQVLTVSGNRDQAQASGRMNSGLRILGTELPRLSPIDAYQSSGTIILSLTKLSETSSRLGTTAEQTGSMTVKGQELETLQKVRIDLVGNEQGNQATTYGTMNVALGAKSSFGWLILLVDLSIAKDGKTSITCVLNGNPVTGIDVCHKFSRAIKLLMVQQPQALRLELLKPVGKN